MDSIDRMRQRMLHEYEPSNQQSTHHSRNVANKLKSFHHALHNSYQSELISLDDDHPEDTILCLINPSRLTEQFDKKVISIDFDKGVDEGTVFYWNRTEKHWIVDLQQHTEEAYFRGTISRCDYEMDVEGTRYWVSLRGPIEADFSWSQKHGLYFNDLNYSLKMIITKNKQTLDYFSRFQVVKVFFTYFDEDGEKVEETHKWQVCATDKYSSDGTIEVYLDEYADNQMEEEMKSEEEKLKPGDEDIIHGNRIIKPFSQNNIYEISSELANGYFVLNSNKVEITKTTNTSITFDVLTGKACDLEIKYITNDNKEYILPIKVTSI